MDGLAPDKALSAGLAFTNWCASEGIHPNTVTDLTLQTFLGWLETKTLHPKPRELARRIPHLWNRASNLIAYWPRAKLARLSFRKSSIRLGWSDLPESFRKDVELYRMKRVEVFEDSIRTPRRALAESTLRLQCEHLRLAASVLSKETGAQVTSLACLVTANAFRTVLRHFREASRRKFLEAAKSTGDETAGRDNKYPPNAFVVGLAATLIQVAYFHTEATDDDLHALRRWASKLTPVPLDLNEKTKKLLRYLESNRVRAKLLFLPERLLAEVAKNLKADRLHFVDAQVAIAIDILLAVPLRPQNLSALHWQRHLSVIDGTDRLLLHIPAKEMKSQQELVAEIPEDVSRRLKWYRQYVLPRLGGDPNGCLFIAQGGSRKDQKTLAGQIIDGLAVHIGVHMTPHQFRHFAAVFYLEHHPEDFETPRKMLGHAFAKTTQIYAGSSTRRAGRAYGRFLFARRDELKNNQPIGQQNKRLPMKRRKTS